jgi:hypothetical protein
MAETLKDRVVQSAVGRVAVRAERQENVGQLAATFVDPGISVQLENDNNQILYGRRGTGKTHVLKVVERAAAEASNQFAVYIDMRTLGSSSVFTDEGRPTHVRVTSLLKDVLGLLENSLLEWATQPERDVPGHVLEALDALSTAITASVIVEPTTTVEEAATTENRQSASGSLNVGPSPSIGLKAAEEQVSAESRQVTRTGRELSPVYFQELAQASP